MNKRDKQGIREPKLRQSITFTKEQHDAIAQIAEQNQVSFCWVVRYACTNLIKERGSHKPLHNLQTDTDIGE